MQICRKIYYDKITGDIILNTGEAEGNVREIPFEEYLEMSPGIADAGVMELQYGEYSEFFETKNVSVNIETKELIFTPFPDPTIIEEPIDEEKVMMAETIIALETELELLKGGV